MIQSDRLTLREFAAVNIGQPTSVSENVARQTFLSRLPGMDYRPSDEWRAGVVLTSDGESAGDRPFASQAVRRARRQWLQTEVQAFAAEFWSMPPENRKVRHTVLLKDCENEPALKHHLKALADGLSVEAGQFDQLDGLTAELGALIRDSFVLTPPLRTAKRNEWLAKTQEEAAAWDREAATIRRTARNVAELDPVLMNAIAKRSPGRVAPMETKRRPLPQEPLFQQNGNLDYTPRPQTQKPSIGNWLWVAGILIALLAKIFSSGSGDQKSSVPNALPNTPYTLPSVKKFEYDPRTLQQMDERARKIEEELRKLREDRLKVKTRNEDGTEGTPRPSFELPGRPSNDFPPFRDLKKPGV